MGTALGYPGDRTPLLAPIGAVFMAWADDAAVTQWIERAALSSPLEDFYRRVLVDIKGRGFSVPLPAIATPTVAEAVARLRDEPTDGDAERHYAEALQSTDELLLLLDQLDLTHEVQFKTIAAPIFDPIGRVLLSISITGQEAPVPVSRVLDLGRRVAQSASVATRQSRGRAPDESTGEVATSVQGDAEAPAS